MNIKSLFVSFFTPNKRLSKKTMGFLALSQALAFFAIWFLKPAGIFPTPSGVVKAFSELWSVDGIAVELINSFQLNLEVIFFTIIISLFLSYLTVMPFFAPLAWLFSKGRFASTVGLTFFVTVMTSGAHQLKLVLMVFLMSVFFVTSMYDTIRNTLQEELDYGRVIHKNEWGVVWDVIVLGKIDIALDILRQVAAIGWAALTMVEGLARSGGGIGVLLLNSNKYLNLDKILAIQICILLIGVLQDYAIGWFKEILCPYAAMEQGKK